MNPDKLRQESESRSGCGCSDRRSETSDDGLPGGFCAPEPGVKAHSEQASQALNLGAARKRELADHQSWKAKDQSTCCEASEPSTVGRAGFLVRRKPSRVPES